MQTARTGKVDHQIKAYAISHLVGFFGGLCLLFGKGFQSVEQDDTVHDWVRNTAGSTVKESILILPQQFPATPMCRAISLPGNYSRTHPSNCANPNAYSSLSRLPCGEASLTKASNRSRFTGHIRTCPIVLP